MPPICRILRVIEYVGTPEFIRDAINKRSVKGRMELRSGNVIQEAIIGDVYEIFAEQEIVEETP